MLRYKLILLAALAITTSGALAETPLSPGSFDLGRYKGKVVYLDFWASWCGPCKLSFPYMDQLSRQFPGRDLVIIADNLDRDSAKAESFLREVGTDIPVMFDSKGVLATRFDVGGMPTSVLIDRQGKIRYVHEGFFKSKEDEYTSHVVELIKERNPEMSTRP